MTPQELAERIQEAEHKACLAQTVASLRLLCTALYEHFSEQAGEEVSEEKAPQSAGESACGHEPWEPITGPKGEPVADWCPKCGAIMTGPDWTWRLPSGKG